MILKPSLPHRSVEPALTFLLWAILAAIMLGLFWSQIGWLDFRDPDDALRMTQVRDLLGGQAWFDTTQYRINPAGGGGDIHWSRFIDVQISALILLLQPLLGDSGAERWAAAIYPLMLILMLLLLFGRILARLGDATFVRSGLLIAATTATFLHYFTPLRIDHHNWQMILSLAMLWLALGPASMVRGLLAALVIALHLEISLEGLPYLVMFGALYGVEWLRDPRETPRLFGFAVGLALVAPLWVLLMRGPGGVAGIYCDAFSRPYIAGAMATGLMIAGLIHLPVMRKGWTYRLAMLALAGLVGAVVFALTAPQCLAGPFVNLDPLVREHWYKNIDEGNPIWMQPAKSLALLGLPSLAGLVALVWNLRRPEIAPWRAQWQRLALVAAASFILSLFVLRTSMVTHAFLVPAFILPYLVYRRWARSRTSAAARIPATAASIAFLPAVLGAIGVLIVTPFVPEDDNADAERCVAPAALATLAKQPPTTIFATIDIGPALLVNSGHSVTATGHHRNNAAIHRVLSGFMASPDRAEPLVRGSGATLLVYCRNMADFGSLRKTAPQGLAAQLYRGAPPRWLLPAPELGTKQLKVYRLTPVAAPSPE